ncbi:MAG TPA: hypothetical protein VGL48_10185 [Acidimicrobiales bacterium]|jgi:hypothetical protein
MVAADDHWYIAEYGEIEMSALVIFSPNVQRLAGFYELVLEAQSIVESSGDVRLRNDLDEVLIHSIPGTRAAQIEIRVPPAPP